MIKNIINKYYYEKYVIMMNIVNRKKSPTNKVNKIILGAVVI